MKGKEAKGGARYVVLVAEKVGAAEDTVWAQVATVTARSGAEAIKTAANGEPGEYRAFPLRSDTHGTISVSTKTVVSFASVAADGGALTARDVVEQTGVTVKP